MQEDIRWKQRFQSYKDAFSRLENAVKLGEERALSELEQQGLVQAFEFTHEFSLEGIEGFSGISRGVWHHRKQGCYT